jgi:hypothetical protein
VCGSIRYTAISRNDELAVKYFGSDTTREFQLDSTYLLDFTPLAPSHVIGTLDVPVRVRISTALAKGVICSSWPSGLRRDEQEGGFMIGGTGDSVRDTNSWGGMVRTPTGGAHMAESCLGETGSCWSKVTSSNLVMVIYFSF